MLVAVCHSPATGWVEVTDLTELSELRVESGNLLWAEADVATLDDEEIALIFEFAEEGLIGGQRAIPAMQ